MSAGRSYGSGYVDGEGEGVLMSCCSELFAERRTTGAVESATTLCEGSSVGSSATAGSASNSASNSPS